MCHCGSLYHLRAHGSLPIFVVFLKMFIQYYHRSYFSDIYRLSVSESTPLDSTVSEVIKATDVDTGLGGSVIYTLTPSQV